jgi:6-phosphogluconolactonase
VAGVRGRKRTVFFVDQDAAAEVPEGLIDRDRYWTANDEG